MGNSTEFCADFGDSYFVYNMSMKESRQPYQCPYFQHNQLKSESMSENFTIAHLIVWTRQTIEFNVSNHAKL